MRTRTEASEEHTTFDVIICEGCWKAGLVLSSVGCGPVIVVMVGYSWLHDVCFDHVFLDNQNNSICNNIACSENDL